MQRVSLHDQQLSRGGRGDDSADWTSIMYDDQRAVEMFLLQRREVHYENTGNI